MQTNPKNQKINNQNQYKTLETNPNVSVTDNVSVLCVGVAPLPGGGGPRAEAGRRLSTTVAQF